MALIFVDGFDGVGGTTSAPEWIKYSVIDNSGSGVQYQSTSGKFGGGALVMKDSGTSDDSMRTENLVFDSPTHVCIGFWFQATSVPGTMEIARVYDTSNRYFQIRVSVGRIDVSDYASAFSQSVRATGVTNVCDGAWHWIEVRHLAGDGTAGEAEIYVDGVQDALVTGTDTNSGGTLQAENFLWLIDENLGSTLFYIDDLVIYDDSGSGTLRSSVNYPVGPLKIESIRPDSTGANAGFTSNSTAANWENVDDATPDDDTSYNSSTSYSAVDTFGYGSLTSTSIRDVLGVAINGVARKDGANTILSQHVVISSGSTGNGPQLSHSTAYNAMSQYLITEDPATSTRWTTASLDAVEFGYATSSST